MMHSPPHPGQIVRDVIDEASLTITESAKLLGVCRNQLNRLVNEKSGISPEMALRLEAVFGSTAEGWVRMQATWDLRQAQKNAPDNISKLQRYEMA